MNSLKKFGIISFVIPIIGIGIAALFDTGIIIMKDGYQISLMILAVTFIPVTIYTLILLSKQKVKRKSFTKATKELVLKQQNHQCKVCKISADYWDFDHIGSRGDNSAKNCQALCLNCHREKTVREARQRKK